jgi:L-threonylcarbamoyladenylate synthase
MVSPELLRRAAELIRQGRLVAFPTETVYGLGANALDEAAVGRVFHVKGRPATNPLIVHVDSVQMARGLVRRWPDAAEELARRYWPGPLTLILPKLPLVPDCVTAGLDTVGIRAPDHPLALALIREAGVPVAAPSANPFTGLSPTTAEHVRRTLGGAVDMILDGGPCRVGIESTVLSLAGDAPRLLRPGMISRDELASVIGPVAAGADAGGPMPSPGMHPRHYSPSTPLLLVASGAALPTGRGAYLWRDRPAWAERSIRMPLQAADYAALLYEILHREDGEGWDWIAVETPPDAPEWAGIRDRLARAARRS